MKSKLLESWKAMTVLLILHGELAGAAVLTWTGASPGDWQNSTNWNPAQVPTSVDTAIILSGTVTNTTAATFKTLILTNDGRISGPLVIASGAALQFGGGRIEQWVRVENGGLLNSVGTTYSKVVFGSITNAGTVQQSGWGLQVANNSAVLNLPGAVWDIQDDSGVAWSSGLEAFYNQGTLRKSGGSGSSGFNPRLLNSGLVQVQSGSLYLNGGGAQLDGTFNVSEGARLDLASGPFNFTPPVNWLGTGEYRFLGGTITLDRIIPNLQLLSGSLSLAPSFQGGALTNFTLTGCTLTTALPITGTLTVGGNAVVYTTNTVTGSLILTNGAFVSGPLVIASGAALQFGGGRIEQWVRVENGGLLNSVGTTYGKVVFGSITNAGTVQQSGWGLQVANNSAVLNLPGAVWDIQDDSGVAWSSGLEAFYNQGTLRKSGGSGSSVINPHTVNAGILDAQSGTIYFNSTVPAYIQTGAILSFGLISSNNSGKVMISDNLNLDGSLVVKTLGNYVPAGGNTFSLITSSSRAGAFNNFNLPALSSGLAWQISYTATSVGLNVVSNTSTATQILGSIKNGSGPGVSNITVFAFTTNANPLYVATATDAAGNYSLQVANGTWFVGLQNLAARGFNPVTNQIAIVNNANVAVNFQLQPYVGPSFTITTVANPQGAGTAVGGGVYVPDSLVSVSASPITNSAPYSFLNWTENSVFQSASNNYLFRLDRDRHLIANFTLPSYQIVASHIPAGAGSVIGAGAAFWGATNVLVANPNFGYKFAFWTEGTNVVGTNPTLSTIVYTNHVFVANYSATNPLHFVTTASSPAGIASVSGAGVYSNGQSATLTAPSVTTNGANRFTFQRFTLNGNFLNDLPSFTKTFSTTDPSNITVVAFYSGKEILPKVIAAAGNIANPVWATTNFVLSIQFDRSMNTTNLPLLILTNREAVLQPTVPSGGIWSSRLLVNDTFQTPPISFTQGMDGTNLVWVSAARDLFGAEVPLTNVQSVLVDATFPKLSNVAVSASAISAVVTWLSDEPSYAQADYGTNSAYSSTTGLSGPLSTAHSVNLNGLLPSTLYHFRIRARDAAGNETLSGDQSFTTVPPPDLQVTNLAISGNLVSGSPITISWADVNTGGGPTFAYWFDRLGVTNLTTGQGLLDTFLYYDPSVRGNISVSGTRPQQTSFQLPNGPNGVGTLVFTVTVNDYNNQLEANSTGTGSDNNSASVTRSVAPASYADLVVSNLAVNPTNPQSGSIVAITWDDSNAGQGPVVTPFQDRISVFNQTTGQMLLDTLLPYDPGANGLLLGGQRANRQMTLTLPNGPAGVGTLRITVAANALNSAFEYSTNGTALSNNTNSLLVNATLAPYADLSVTNVIVPATANAGQTISVTWTESNRGAGFATNDWYDQVFLAGVNAIGEGQLLGTFLNTNGLATNQSVTITRSVMLPQFVQSNQWLIVRANASASFFELNISNNSAISQQSMLVTPTLLLSFSESSISESAGTNSVLATLTRNGTINAALNVQLATATGTNVYVPTNVTISAGNSAATFLLGPVDNLISGAPVAEAITATANGFQPATATLTILEDDPATLALNLSVSSVSENAGINSVTGTVRRNANLASALTVNLISDNLGALTVPATVTIPSGQASTNFGMTPVAIPGLSDTRRVNVLASAPGFTSVSVPLDVLNANSVPLSLSLSSSVATKGAGSLAVAGTVRIASGLPTDQDVQLTVLNNSLVTVPGLVTIPAGATSAGFQIGVGNDNVVTGPQTATLLARPLTPGGFPQTNGQATATLQILDTNGPSLTLTLAAHSISKGSNTLATVSRNTLPTNAITIALTSSPAGIVSLPASLTLSSNQTSASFTVTGVLDNTQTGSRAVTLTAAAASYNSAAATLMVSDIYLPDLMPIDVSIPTNALTGSSVSISWVVGNNGLGAATNRTWYDYVYLMSGNADQNEQLMTVVTNVSILPVAATYTNRASIYLPFIPGNYWIKIVTDGGGTVSELNKGNNALIASALLPVNPSYLAAITNITPLIAPAGTPISLSGWVYDAATGHALANTMANVSIVVNDMHRTYPVSSDSDGRFFYTFQPLPNEGGDYTVGAGSPYSTEAPVQGTFVLLNMQAMPVPLNVQLLPNVPLSGQLVLTNLSSHSLSGLQFIQPNLQGNLSAEFSFTNRTLAGRNSMTVGYTFQSPLTRAAKISFTAIATSTEGAQVLLPITATVVPLAPQLIANPGYLSSGMLVGQQTVASFDVLNTGGASSGDLAVQLPTNLTWMKLSSPALIPSIPAGGKATVTLILNPPADLPLTLYNGNLAVFNNTASLSLPFQFRAVSSATGDLQVTATDDYTYYVADAPKVTNGIITVRDPFTSAIVAQTNTDSQGFAYFRALPAGPYTVEGTSPKHSQFRGSITITPGNNSSVEAFMARQLITYQWTVVPTEIQDSYKVVLETVFETEVPVPNVVVEEPQVTLLMTPGEVSEFTIKLSNHGLIAANQVRITVPDDPDYIVTPLITEVGTIPAQSSVEIPVAVRERSTPVMALANNRGVREPQVISPSTGCDLSKFNKCLPKIPLGVVYYYRCGPNGLEKYAFVDLSLLCVAKDTYKCLKGIGEIPPINPDPNPFLGGCTKGAVTKCLCKGLAADISCLALGGVSTDPCAKAAIKTACGAVLGFFTGGGIGAVGGAASSGGGAIVECICDKLRDKILPLIPPAPLPPTYCLDCFHIDNFYGGVGQGGSVQWAPYPFPIVTGTDVPGECTVTNSQSTAKVQSASLPNFLTRLRGPLTTQTTRGVCARVRLRIEQDVTLTRSAFKGTLELENGGDTSISHIQLNLDFRDATNGAATSRFIIEGPVVSGMGAVDGTGILAGGANGSATYTFIPTLSAAPNAPESYQIGGTLSYIDNGELVVVPLLSAPITVYPEAQLDLLYFQQRNVYADDPFTAQMEPSEPFALGLLVKNVGAGPAHNFQITSGQPQIVENEKGLLINFNIIGTMVGDQPLSPSLSANLGDIPPGSTKEVTWQMLSTLQGKFISFDATFQHVNDLGATNNSLIKNVEIHELTHQVLANRPIDDRVPDFLVNDIADPDNFPDTLYLSDGSIAAVNGITNGTFDGQAAPGHLQVRLSVIASNGWNYIQLPNPGPEYLLQSVVRSDGKSLALTNNAWTTDRSFPSSSPGAVRENLLNLFDWAGSGIYTLYYRSTNTTPPAIMSLGPVTPFNQSGAVSAIDVVFSEVLDTNTFSYTNLVLTRDGGANLITSGTSISLTFISNTTYSISGLAPFTAADGNYQLTLNGSGLYDLWGNSAGDISALTQWSKGNAAVVVQSISSVVPNPRNFPVDNVTVNFSKPINPSTFSYRGLSLTLNGGPNLITSAVTVTQQSANAFAIDGLGPITGGQGNYLLKVHADSVQDSGGAPGFGSSSVNWRTITTGPAITELEQITTNPRNIVVRTLNVRFSEPIDTSTFDYRDITLTRDGGPNLITSDVTVTELDATSFQIGNISWVQGYAGNYSLTANATGLNDLAGNSGAGSTNASWQMILGAPAAPANLSIAADLGISPVDGLTSTNTVTLRGVLATPDLVVRIFDETAGADLGIANVVGTNFSQSLNFTILGSHRLRVTTTDLAGNVSLPAYFDLFVDLTLPTATFEDVLPNPHFSAVTNLTVTFSEIINTNTISTNNFLLVRNGANFFTPTLQRLSGPTYQVGGMQSFSALPGTYQLVVNLSGIQDLSGNAGIGTVSMSWVNGLTNLPPLISQVTNITIGPGSSLEIPITISDPNSNEITLQLSGLAPTGAMLTTNGVFTWTPSCIQGGTTNVITVLAIDNGVPPLSNTMSFTITVGDCLQVGLGSGLVPVGQTSCLPLNLISTAALTNLSLIVSYPTNYFTNLTVTVSNAAIRSSTVTSIDPAHTFFNFSINSGQVLQGPALIGSICFRSASGPSAFVELPITSISGIKSNGAPAGNVFGKSGQMIVIAREPLLQAWLNTNAQRMLTLYGNPGATYALGYRTNLSGTNWQFAWRTPMTNFSETFEANQKPVQLYYRAWEFFADPPILELRRVGPTDLVLLSYGKAGTNYILETNTNLSNSGNWLPMASIAMSNSFQFINQSIVTNRGTFFRMKRL
jgi:hypothetical protein